MVSIQDARIRTAPADSSSLAAEQDFAVEVEVTRSGGPAYRLERDPRMGSPRVVGLVPGPGAAAVDEATVVGAVNEDGQPLDTLIVRQVPLPEGARLHVRMIGAVVVGPLPWMLGVPTVDRSLDEITDVSRLGAMRRADVEAFVRAETDRRCVVGSSSWLSADRSMALTREAARRGQLLRNEQRRAATAPVVWQATSLALRRWRVTEAEAFTSAEYDILRLPFRFQGYAREALDPDERVLVVIPRPAAQPGWKEFFGVGRAAPGGVLVVTDRQVVLLEEALPPGLANANWGYRARTTANERIISAQVRLHHGASVLELAIAAEGGEEMLAPRLPVSARPEVEKAAELLSRFRPSDGRWLRRLPPVDPREENGHEAAFQLVSDSERDRALSLARGALPSDEDPLREAVAPAASASHGVTGLILTRHRLVAADIASGNVRVLRLNDISSLELLNGLMVAKITFFAPKARRVDSLTVYFPYTVGVEGFVELARAVRLLLGMPRRCTDAHSDPGAQA